MTAITSSHLVTHLVPRVQQSPEVAACGVVKPLRASTMLRWVTCQRCRAIGDRDPAKAAAA
jgi:hypothetical protein